MVSRKVSRSREYRSYESMIYRCTNPSHTYYYRYGGRGITVCDRWLESFDNFLEDMGFRPEGTTLDRINNDGDYEASNCRWATQSEQARNSESVRLISAFGETKSIVEWAEDARCKTNITTLYKRLSSGWSAEKAILVETQANVMRTKHGTYHMYTKYGCRCQPCKDGAREYRKQRHARITANAERQ